MTKLADIKAEFAKYFVVKDPWAIEMVLASVIGNMVLDRDPIWIMIIGPSSGGKTTILAPLAGIERVFFIDDLTEKTLLSGYKIKGKEYSLLRRIGSGILAFSDFTSILSKNMNSKGEILTQLKLVYDGKVTKYTGTGGLPWEGKMGFIGACTPDIYTHLENSRSMGERFLYYWFDQPTNKEIMEKQKSVAISSKEITLRMQELYGSYYNDVKEYAGENIPELKLTPVQRQRVDDAAQFCILGKATIRTDFKTGKPDAIPNISGVGRDIKIFDTLLHTLQLMNCYENDDRSLPVQDWMIDAVEKCAYSSINRERRKILEILTQNRDPMTASTIGANEGLGLEKESTEKYLRPLHAVGLIKKNTLHGAHQWFIDDEDTIAFVDRVSKEIVDTTIAVALEPNVIEYDMRGEHRDDEFYDANYEAQKEFDSLPAPETLPTAEPE